MSKAASEKPIRSERITNMSKPVSMKLFAAWEVDRTPSDCIPRYELVTNRFGAHSPLCFFFIISVGFVFYALVVLFLVCVSLIVDDSAFTQPEREEATLQHFTCFTSYYIAVVLLAGRTWSDIHSPHATRWITADERYFSLCYTIVKRLRIREIDSSFVFFSTLSAVCARQYCKWIERKKNTETIYIKILDAVHALARSHFSSIYHWILKSVCAHCKHSWACLNYIYTSVRRMYIMMIYVAKATALPSKRQIFRAFLIKTCAFF